MFGFGFWLVICITFEIGLQFQKLGVRGPRFSVVIDLPVILPALFDKGISGRDILQKVKVDVFPLVVGLELDMHVQKDLLIGAHIDTVSLQSGELVPILFHLDFWDIAVYENVEFLL